MIKTGEQHNKPCGLIGQNDIPGPDDACVKTMQKQETAQGANQHNGEQHGKGYVLRIARPSKTSGQHDLPGLKGLYQTQYDDDIGGKGHDMCLVGK